MPIRFLDIIISITAMAIVLPFLVLLSVVMVLAQGLPVIFSQERSGKEFRTFRIYKLRTMKNATEDESGLTRGLQDERITKIGLILRKYKIDELPQLFNIILGNMSVVGPRPQVPFYARKFDYYYQEILSRKPGLLSPSAIKYSNEEELLGQVADPVKYYEEVLVPEKCEMDIGLVTGFSVGKYFSVIITYVKKIIFRA